MEKIKSTYVIWHGFHVILPQTQRYTLGNRIDKLFIEIIEAVSIAIFLPKPEKSQFVRSAMQKLDTMKILLLVLWEIKAIPNKRYAALSKPLDEIGRMLGGWNNQINKTP